MSVSVVSLIGAPTDIGAGTRGASMGPEALRIAQLATVLEGQGARVRDLGDLAGPRNPLQAAQNGYRHLGEVVEWKNEDIVPHTAAADTGVAHKPIFDSGTINTGAAWRYVPRKKGTYNYTCSYHQT